MFEDESSVESQAWVWLLNSDYNDLDLEDLQILRQRYALAALYLSTGGETWTSSDNWMTDASVCEWYPSDESQCDDDGYLIELNLYSNNLDGELPVDIGVLSDTLRVLDLEGNRDLGGTLPAGFWSLDELREVDIAGCDFRGRLSSSVSGMSKLRVFRGGRNRFEGPLPGEFGLLPELEVLRLARNRLNGEIPAGLGSSSTLRHLRLGSNRFVGTLSSALGDLSSLQEFWVESNTGLNGTIPESFLDLTSLSSARFQNTGLSGEMPFCVDENEAPEELEADCSNFEDDCPCCTLCPGDGPGPSPGPGPGPGPNLRGRRI